MILDPNALASCADEELDGRPEVQYTTENMIFHYIMDTRELPSASAGPFAAWLDLEWNDFNEEGNLTNGEVISGALAFWRGY